MCSSRNAHPVLRGRRRARLYSLVALFFAKKKKTWLERPLGTKRGITPIHWRVLRGLKYLLLAAVCKKCHATCLPPTRDAAQTHFCEPNHKNKVLFAGGASKAVTPRRLGILTRMVCENPTGHIFTEVFWKGLLSSVSSSNLRRSMATLPGPAPNVPDTASNWKARGTSTARMSLPDRHWASV